LSFGFGTRSSFPLDVGQDPLWPRSNPPLELVLPEGIRGDEFGHGGRDLTLWLDLGIRYRSSDLDILYVYISDQRFD